MPLIKEEIESLQYNFQEATNENTDLYKNDNNGFHLQVNKEQENRNIILYKLEEEKLVSSITLSYKEEDKIEDVLNRVPKNFKLN